MLLLSGTARAPRATGGVLLLRHPYAGALGRPSLRGLHESAQRGGVLESLAGVDGGRRPSSSRRGMHRGGSFVARGGQGGGARGGRSLARTPHCRRGRSGRGRGGGHCIRHRCTRRRRLRAVGLALCEVPQRCEVLGKGLLGDGLLAFIRPALLRKADARLLDFVLELGVLHFLKEQEGTGKEHAAKERSAMMRQEFSSNTINSGEGRAGLEHEKQVPRKITGQTQTRKHLPSLPTNSPTGLPIVKATPSTH